MNRIRSAMLAASAIACLTAATAPAEAQRYFARERLMINNGNGTDPAPTTDPTPTPTRYNSYIYDVRRNTRNVNGCSFSNDGTKAGFATWRLALDWCETVKAGNPNYMSCMIKTLNDGSKQASVSSSACAPTWSGTNWATGDDGHYIMQQIASAYK
jgi:hypothetical protein